MHSYDEWKTRSDRDEHPWNEDEPEPDIDRVLGELDDEDEPDEYLEGDDCDDCEEYECDCPHDEDENE